jgi:hypothetical protein
MILDMTEKVLLKKCEKPEGFESQAGDDGVEREKIVSETRLGADGGGGPHDVVSTAGWRRVCIRAFMLLKSSFAIEHVYDSELMRHNKSSLFSESKKELPRKIRERARKASDLVPMSRTRRVQRHDKESSLKTKVKPLRRLRSGFGHFGRPKCRASAERPLCPEVELGQYACHL